MEYAYHCGNCGLDARMTVAQTTEHWRECFTEEEVDDVRLAKDPMTWKKVRFWLFWWGRWWVCYFPALAYRRIRTAPRSARVRSTTDGGRVCAAWLLGSSRRTSPDALRPGDQQGVHLHVLHSGSSALRLRRGPHDGWLLGR